VGAGVLVIGRTGSYLCVPMGHRVPAQGKAQGAVSVIPRRSCSTLAERLSGSPRISTVAPWTGPFGAEADTALLAGSQLNRPRSNNERVLFGLAQMRVFSLFCQPESIDIDFAKALGRRPAHPGGATSTGETRASWPEVLIG
jgi:hypothetical protein